MQVQTQTDELLAHRASEWLEMLPTASEAERKEFAEWLSASRLHVQAFLEVAEIEHSLHRIDHARQYSLKVPLSRVASNVVPLRRPAITSEPGSEFSTEVGEQKGGVKLTVRPTSGTEEGESRLLEAGQETDIHLDGTITQKADAVVANTVAWRQRRLAFEEATLEEMFAEFNRYNAALRFRLEGDVPDGHRYTGVFDAADPESFVSLLSRESDLSIERHGDEVIVRSRAATGN